MLLSTTVEKMRLGVSPAPVMASLSPSPDPSEGEVIMIRRNVPLTDSQVATLKAILASHGVSSNPKAKKRKHGKKRRISASLRRKLLANLCKARAAKKRKGSKHRKARRVVRRVRRHSRRAK